MVSRTEQLKAVAGGAPTKTPISQRDIASLMADPAIKKQMALALPKHLTAERLARIATTEIRRVPELASCSRESFLGAIMQCAQLGIEPSNGLGHAYLIPFGNGNDKQGRPNVQLIVGYRGMIDLARRSGQIISISARAVYENDEFSYKYGLHEDLKHKPSDGIDAGALTHVYAVARLHGGGVQFEVMSRKQIELARAHSKAKNGPWFDHYEEMAKKTVIRRLFKYLPVSIEIQRAVSLDERAEAGIDQQNDVFFETGEAFEADYTVVSEEPQPTLKHLNND